jgi:ABC-type sugar transport system permease subunit
MQQEGSVMEKNKIINKKNNAVHYSGKKKEKKRKSGLMERQSRNGWFFIAPWLVGFVYFFAIPLLKSLYYTFTKISITNDGLQFQFAGLQNYLTAFTVDPDFIRAIAASIGNIIYQVPIIVFFSLFIAMILKQDFHGKTLMRSIFFLPVIISSGVVITILKENVFAGSAGQSVTLFQTGVITELLVKSGMGMPIVKMITTTVGAVFDLTWRSGVQILLLLSALHTIPDSMYEAARMEGATEWETFWKITFVLISPTLVMTIIYSIIDYFTDYSNKVMRMIVTYVNQGKYEYSTTISIIYFAIVLLLILFVDKVLSKRAYSAVN